MSSRPLVPAERMADRFEPAYTQNFTTVATVRGALNKEGIECALRCLEQRHPLLRARIDRSQAEPRFVAGEAGEVPLFVVDASQDVLPELIARCLEPRAWSELGYHAELSWVRHGADHSSLLLRQHHLISDGSSGIVAMRDLLAFIAEPPRTRVEAIASPGQELYFPASFAELRRTSLEQMRAGAPSQPAAKPIRLSRWQDSSLARRRACTRLLRLNASESAALARRARQDGATVHGALMAAYAIAIVQETGEGGLVRMAHPVDLRRYLREIEPSAPPIPDAVGYYVSSITTDHDVREQAELGALAREITQAVRAGKSAREPLCSAPIRGPALVERTRQLDVDAFRDLCEQRVFTNTFGLSNLGPLERLGAAPRVGALQIDDFFFAGATSVMNQIGGSAISFDGRLLMVMTCVEPMVSHELLAALALRLAGLLRGYAELS